ncbi:MBL fold metallo-hydrolase [Uliginosibacterium gangwonense]|uniref:MBL fold metallo-hydrolase n=1 Tax=Uliginosibacterium gangwonense TaxID=392736 RepID=UPI00047690D2|nr:MBL fold metallo-hydrolase [Uliginosibacterium gangwonense]
MELIFLGTSAGTPTRGRNVSACALRLVNQRAWYLIDCGEGTQHRLLSTPLSLRALEAVCITHVHGDHTFGLPGLIASAQMAKRTEALKILAPAGVKEYVETALRCSDTFIGFPLEWVEISAKSGTTPLEGVSVTSTALSHRVPSYAYCFAEAAIPGKLDRPKLQALGIPAGPDWARLKAGEDITLADGRTLHSSDFVLPARAPRQIIIAGDNDTPGLLTDLCAQAQVLVHEATYTQAVSDKVGPEPQHCSAQHIAQFAQETQVPNLILTHFSARYANALTGPDSIEELREEAARHYTGRLFLAQDYARYMLDKTGLLTEALP